MPSKPKTKSYSARILSVAKKVKKDLAKQARAKTKSKAGLNKTEKRQVKALVKSKMETKYCPSNICYDDYDTTSFFFQATRTNPVTLPGISPASDDACNMLAFQTGYYLNSQSTDVNTNVGGGSVVPLGGYGMQEGTESTEIVGDHAYLQSAKCDLQITALPFTSNNSVVYGAGMSSIQFRVLHLQSKKIATGIVPNYTNALFWDRQHTKVGLSFSGTVKEIMEDFHINTEQFTVHKDIKFRLTQPMNPAALDTWTIQQNDQATAQQTGPVNWAMQGSGTNPTYPTAKNLTLWMPKTKKKIRFAETDNGSTNAFEPTNYNFVNFIVILAARTNQSQTIPSNMSVSRAWSAKAAMETRFKDG